MIVDRRPPAAVAPIRIIQHGKDNTNMPTDIKQMDAVVIEGSGPPARSLGYRREPVPEPGPGEVLVEVHAAAVNPLDVANAAGRLGTPLPVIPGGDYAGIKQVLLPTGGDHQAGS